MYETFLCSMVEYAPLSFEILIFKPGKALATPLFADFHVALSAKALAKILFTTDRSERTPHLATIGPNMADRSAGQVFCGGHYTSSRSPYFLLARSAFLPLPR